ncbi:MAG: DNA primase, partial [Treponema sp.]|nr:DNA primase [Treponema sp.]
MSGRITRESLDEVTSRTDIVSVVGEYVALTQKGNDWWGCCPFHNEKTPSFKVDQERKLYYCFGCHKGGNA